MSAYTEMASTAAPAPLNPEPSQPEERAEHHLPPKSYADAVSEPTDHNGNLNGHDSGAANGSAHKPQTNGQTQQLDGDKVIYQKHVSTDGRTLLTSISPTEDHEESLRHNERIAPREKKAGKTSKKRDARNDELASGRMAGAGWQTSA